jgi:hypothetical protein
MKKIAFILDGFELESPAQHLLDRFLIGYNWNGEFKNVGAKISVFAPGAKENPLVQARSKEFGLEIADSMAMAASGADLLITVPGAKASPDAKTVMGVREIVPTLTSGKAAYIDAALLPGNGAVFRAANRVRPINVIVSRAAFHFVALPVRPQFRSGDVRKVLVVAQGEFPEGELDAIYAAKPYLPETWPLGESPKVEALASGRLWDLVYSAAWRPLLAAAISRSSNIKGDPERDGRTQDVVGLHLLDKLAPNARGWRLQGESGPEIVLLLCEEALGDFNIAAEMKSGIHSANLYRPQAPMQDHYSDLAAWIIGRLKQNPIEANLMDALEINRIITEMTTTP